MTAEKVFNHLAHEVEAITAFCVGQDEEAALKGALEIGRDKKLDFG